MHLVHPLKPTRVAQAVPNPVASTTISGRILVIDDDDTLRNLLAKGLRRAAYRISCANNGEAGWTTLCADSFDLVITDHEMPRLTGLNLLRRIRLGPLQLPVILMSGNLPWEEEDLPRLLPPGLAMGKPFYLVDLLENVRRLLEFSRVT